MGEKFFKNIGGKIKFLAMILFVVEAIAALITGFVLMVTDEDLILYGFLSWIVIPLFAWVSSWFLYAFGELVEDVHAIRNRIAPEAAKTDNQVRTSNATTEVKDEEKEEVAVDVEKADGLKCELCGKHFERLVYCKIKDDMGTRYRNICNGCAEKHHAEKQ